MLVHSPLGHFYLGPFESRTAGHSGICRAMTLALVAFSITPTLGPNVSKKNLPWTIGSPSIMAPRHTTNVSCGVSRKVGSANLQGASKDVDT